MSTSDPRSFAGRPTSKSKILGQIFTPRPIAERMVRHLLIDRPNGSVAILDPCVGPKTFPIQMLECGLLHQGDLLTMIDLDEEMVTECKQWAHGLPCETELERADYLDLVLDCKYDYAILNPPYLRQEWLDMKGSYQETFKKRYGLKVPGTSNLYVYFITKVLSDLKPGGSFGCIVYDSWQSTKYGQWMRDIIDETCEKIEVVPVNEQPFEGRLIDATLIFATKRSKPVSQIKNQLPVVSGGVGHSYLSDVKGFSPIGKVYKTKRGLRLKQADFFLCDLSLCEDWGATPFIKKIARVSGYMVPKDHQEAALLLKSASEHPLILSELERRISLAQNKPQKNESILTWHKERPDSWMLHRTAPYAPVLFNYYIRKRPRHIYNPSRVYSDNFYGLTMSDNISALASLASLNSTVVCGELLACSRNQGSGLAKIQLFEYRDVHAPDLRKCDKRDLQALDDLGRELIETPDKAEDTILRIDHLIADIFKDPRLEPNEVRELLAKADSKARRPKEA